MTIDYIRLQQDLTSLYERLKPRELNLDTDSLRGFYAAKSKRYTEDLAVKTEAAGHSNNRAIAFAAVGSLAGVGMIVAAPATVGVAAGVVFTSAGLAVAKVIANKLGVMAAKGELDRSKDLIGRPAGDLARAYQQDKRGGYLSRLYAGFEDIVNAREHRVKAMIEQIDRLAVPYQSHASSVSRILQAHLDSGLVDYVRRTALDPHSRSAHLMSRVGHFSELSGDWAQKARFERGSPLAILSGSSAGLAALVKRTPLAAMVEEPAVPVRLAPEARYGFISASEGDAAFLGSLGVEIARFDEGAQAFFVKLDQAAQDKLAPFEFAFPANLQTLPAGLTDAVSHTAAVPLASLSGSDLQAYRTSLNFEAARDDGGKLAVLNTAMAQSDAETQRRLAEARARVTGPNVPESVALGM